MRCATNMMWRLDREKTIGVLWRVAVLLLPWQMRWFSEGPAVNGFPWEQGRVSVYASWFVIVATIIVTSYKGQGTKNEVPTSTDTRERAGRPRPYVIAGICLLLFASLFTHSFQATAQWWTEVVLLVGFVWALKRSGVSAESFMRWFVVALIPHALLAIWQFHTQLVIGSKWLGMAAQDPLVRGVSVIESAGRRVLRAYGGFPHPNILGGWLVVGVLASVRVICDEAKKWKRFIWMAVLSLFSVALVLTFARGAWMACVIGLFIVFCLAIFGRGNLAPTVCDRSRLFVVFVLLAITAGTAVFFTHDLFVTRIQATARLETKSLDERRLGFVNGWELFWAHPWAGVGPGATLLQISAEHPKSDVPPVPPHFVPLMVLDEVGMIGFVGLLFLVFGLLRGMQRLWVAPVAVLFVLGLFDHYLWSLWSGCVLVACTVALATLPRKIVLKTGEIP